MAVASRQASGSKASLCVAGYQIGLRHTQLWPRGLHSSRDWHSNSPEPYLRATVSDYVCVNKLDLCVVCVCAWLLACSQQVFKGPFKLETGGGWDQPIPLGARWVSEQGLWEYQEYTVCHSETQQNITAAVINHTACPAHHPPATGYTVKFYLTTNQEQDRIKRPTLNWNN